MDFCESKLWKKSIFQISCDFDFETKTSQDAFVFKEDSSFSNATNNRNRGTLCLMTSAFGKWKVKTGLDAPKRFLPNDQRESHDLSELQFQSSSFFALPVQSSPDNYYLMYRPTTSEKKRVARLFSPFFSNTLPGLCLTFRYLIRGPVTRNSGLKVFLLPCDPPYRIPVLTVTNNQTDSWKRNVVPLPDYKRPYRILFEVRAEDKNLEFVAIDDIVFDQCGELN